MVADIIAGVLIAAGMLLSILGGVGINRFPDVWSRMHAATKPVTLGLAFVLLGTALIEPDAANSVKLVLAAVLQFLTAPVAAHMVGRAAYRGGNPLSPRTGVDELAEARRGDE